MKVDEVARTSTQRVEKKIRHEYLTKHWWYREAGARSNVILLHRAGNELLIY